LKIADLEINEKKIFGLHLLYSIIEGILFGVVALNEFVFIKSLKGSEMQLAVLFQASVIVFVFSIVIHELLKRYKKKNILRITALITRLPMLLIIVFPRELLLENDMVFYHYFFLLIFLFYYLAMPVVFPIINSILKNNYSNSHFGTLYSYAAMTNKIVMMITTFVFGWMLDVDPFSFVNIYPVMGLAEYYPCYFDVGAYRFYYLVVLSFAWNGLFAATMSLLWNIGSAYFCKDNDAGTYQSIHLSMVGVRALIAPVFGIWLYQYIGFSGVFAFGVLLLALAIGVMFWSIRRNRVVIE